MSGQDAPGAAVRPPAETGPHALLRDLFADLEDLGVVWTLLRVPTDVAAPTGDVDILVDPRDAAALRDVALARGFVALPGWDAPPSLLLVAYDGATDRWLVLDVATTVSFRAPTGLRLPVVTEVLARRRLAGGMAVPADGDAFWLLLAHCLLELGAVPERYRDRLRRLAGAAGESGVGLAVAAAAGGHPPPGVLAAAARAGNWGALETMGASLVSEVRRRRPASGRLAAALRSAAARARKPLLLLRRRGLSLALIGPDGAGKTTLAQALQRAYPFESRVVYMGLWKRAGGSPARSVAEVIARPVVIWCRQLLAQYHRLRGRLVIFDRYVYDAHLPPEAPFVALKRPYYWLLRHAAPPTDAAVVLDLPAPVAHRRKPEGSPERLARERLVFAGLARSVPGVEIVDASRSPDAVRADVTALVWRHLVRRWRRPAPSLIGRRARDPRRLAEACALVPRVLAAESAALPSGARRALVTGLEMTSTDMAVVTLATDGEAPCAIVKLPATAEARQGLARESDVVAALRADERLGSWRDLVPRPLAVGAALGQSYRIDAALPGRPPLERVGDAAALQRLHAAAAETIDILHRATARPLTVDVEVLRRWVDAPLAHVARDRTLARRLGPLQDELHGALGGRMFSAGWIHGDYWLGNLLFAPGATRVEGIVDWDAAAPDELPVHDRLHLLLYSRRLAGGAELGRIVRRQLDGGAWSVDERALLDRYAPPDGADSLSERHALLLYWLRHVALHVRQQPNLSEPRYRLWALRNVRPVLAAL